LLLCSSSEFQERVSQEMVPATLPVWMIMHAWLPGDESFVCR
jgi:hypothetical protein